MTLSFGVNQSLLVTIALCHVLSQTNRELTFSESPDPWNSGVDSMSFDFLAHPAPGEPPPQQFYF